MNSTQAILDDIHRLEAALHGKHMELAYAMGERDIAHKHRQSMERAIKAQRDFRIKCGAGECFFDQAGARDAMAIRGVANA